MLGDRKRHLQNSSSAFSFKLTLLWEHDVVRYKEETGEMNDNVIQFRKPKPQKTPKAPPPWLRKVLTVVAVIAVFVAAWAYFRLTA
jgi:hypothetical protein